MIVAAGLLVACLLLVAVANRFQVRHAPHHRVHEAKEPAGFCGPERDAHPGLARGRPPAWAALRRGGVTATPRREMTPAPAKSRSSRDE